MITAVRLREWWRRVKIRMGYDPYLCGTCKWNNPRDCIHRKRPRATICEDYKRR